MPPQIAKGKILIGVPVSETKFQGVSTLNQLEDYGLARPSAVQGSTVAECKVDRRLGEAKGLREQVQRIFNAKRVRRADVYSVYIEDTECNGRFGGTPAITLYLPGGVPARVTEEGLLVPYNASLIAIDGETQTEARFKLRDRRPETGNMPFAITLYHGIPEAHAQQVLHDYNTECHPVSEKEMGPLNHTGALSSAINSALAASALDSSKINRKANKPGKCQTISFEQVRYAAVGYVMKQQALERPASYWFDDLNDVNDASSQTLLGPVCVTALTALINLAISNPEAQKADPLIWQVAGVLLSTGRDPAAFRWGHAAAELATAKKERAKTPAKLGRIADNLCERNAA